MLPILPECINCFWIVKLFMVSQERSFFLVTWDLQCDTVSKQMLTKVSVCENDWSCDRNVHYPLQYDISLFSSIFLYHDWSPTDLAKMPLNHTSDWMTQTSSLSVTLKVTLLGFCEKRMCQNTWYTFHKNHEALYILCIHGPNTSMLISILWILLLIIIE